jgi:arylsulfatase A-like enzyme
VQRRTLTRKEFLKVTGTGLAAGSLLGGATLASGCAPLPGRETRPNVVLLIVDSLRKDHLGAYGNPWIKTPNIDALATQSLRFSRAYPESLPTICARRAIHTGMRTWPFKDWRQYKGVDVVVWGWQPMPEGQRTLAEVLKEEGYTTLFVTDNLHQYKPSMNFQRGFDVFDFIRGQTTDGYKPKWLDSREKVRQSLVKGEGFDVKGQMRRYFANVAGRRTENDWFSPRVFTGAMELMEAASEDQPFFLAVDNYDPHQPWDPPEEYVSLYDEGYDGDEPYMPVGPSSNLTDRQLERMKALYAGEVTMMDRWLGNFLDKMEELNLLENTLLLFISDHGVAHGEHGYTGKPPYALWPEVTDIPFLIRHPEGKGAGEVSDYYASTHDVAPTVLGFLGIEPPEPMDGQDLSVLFEDAEPEERAHFSLGYNDHAWARDDDYAMFAKNDGSNAFLYDLREDPNMDKNIASSNQDLLNRMWNEYVLKDAGGPLPTYGNERPF